MGGAVDSVRLTFICGGSRFSEAWVGAHLATLSDDELWHSLDVATRGGIKKPSE
jgi:hypothetical protein